MNDNQFTDAAQLVATHRAAHADTATARLAQVSADATVPQHASIDTIRYLQARIRELRQENTLLNLKVEFLENHMDDHSITKAVYEYEQALAALDADGERAHCAETK